MYYFLESEGLYCEEEFVAEFCPNVIVVESCYDLDSGEEKRCFLVNVTLKNGESTECKKVEDINKLSFFNLWGIPDYSINATQRKKLIHKMQMDVFDIINEKVQKADGRGRYKKNIVGAQGLYKYEDSEIYFWGDRILYTRQGEWQIKSKMNKILKTGGSSDDKSVIKKFLNLMPGVSEILFYDSLFGVMKPIVIQCGLKPEFILALVGPSGHLKTSMVRLYSLWLEEQDAQEISFRDHRKITTLLSMIDSISGQNFLVDDLHDAISGNVETKQSERLNEIVRHTGKSSKCANIIITAETLKGKGIFSCMDRILQVKIPRMSSEQLKELKKQINELQAEDMVNLANVFLEELMKHYDEVCKEIIDFWNQDSPDDNIFYDTRTYYHNKFIMLTEMVFCKYICCNLPEESGRRQLISALETNYKNQQQDLRMKRTEESEQDLVADLYRMLTSSVEKFIKVETSRAKYMPNDENCLLYEEKYFITGSALKIAMSKYYKRNISVKNIINGLHQACILDEDVDARSKKFQNKRHYIIKLRMLEEYLKWGEEEIIING